MLSTSGDVDSIQDGGEVISSVNSIPSRMSLPINRHTKNRTASLPMTITIHSAGVAHDDRPASNTGSSPQDTVGGVCNSSTPLASPLRGSSSPVPHLYDSQILPVLTTVKVPAKNVREVPSPLSDVKGVPQEFRKG